MRKIYEIANSVSRFPGDVTVVGNLTVNGSATVDVNETVTGAVTVTGDLAVNGGDLTSTATTFNLLNATVTTLNIGGAATTIVFGAASTAITLGSNATINGGSAANDDLTLQGTSNATRTTSYVILQPTTGLVGIGTTSPDRLLHPELADAVTNVVSYPFRLTHITSDTPANSIGVGLEFEQETAADNNEVIATITAVVTDVTATSEDAALVFSTMVAGAAATEGMRVVGSQARFADGTAAAPSITFASDTDAGFYLTANTVHVGIGGTERLRLSAGSFMLPVSGTVCQIELEGDVVLAREAANILALRNGASAQTQQWYETYTDASNYELFEIVMGSDTATLRTGTAGTGADNLNITITPSGTGITTVTGDLKVTDDVLTDSCHIALMAQVFGGRSQWQ